MDDERDRPSAEDRETWRAMVEHDRPLWEALPPESVLRRVCESLYAAFADYFDGSGPPPEFCVYPLCALLMVCPVIDLVS